MNLHLLLRQRGTRTVGISTFLARLVPMILIAALTACGGSSSSGGGGGSTATVTGTAAGGAPIAGATVTLKDAAGNSKTATTGSDGTFSIDVSGLTAPFLLSVAATSSTYYGFASASNTTANLTPYTSVVLQSYYAAQGSTADAVFGGTLTSDSFPSAGQLNILAGSVVSILQTYLINSGVTDPTNFDLFTTTFTADGSGFDQVLDRTQVSGSSPTDFTVDNGTGSTAGAVSSTVTVTVAAAGGAGSTASVTFSTSTTDGTNTSTSQQTVPVGTPTQQTDLDAALNGVKTMFNNIAATAASKGSSFSVTDAEAFIDPQYLDQGKTQADFASDLASFFSQLPSGATVTVSIVRVNSFTDNSASDQILKATVHIAVTSGSTTEDQYVAESDNLSDGMVYHLDSSGHWVFYGNQSIAKAHVELQSNRFYDPVTVPGSYTDSFQIQGQLSVAQGVLTGVALDGASNSLPDCNNFTSTGPVPMTQSHLDLMQDSGTFNGNEDRYDLPCTLQPGQSFPVIIAPASAPPAGTAYTFTLTTAGGTTTQTSTLNSVTTEIIDITSINGVSRSTFVAGNTVSQVAGTQLTIAFTAPSTFPVLYSYITAYCQNANEKANGGGSDIQGDANNIPAGTTTGTITIPAQCDGAAIASLGIDINTWGVNGEHTFVTQNLQP